MCNKIHIKGNRSVIYKPLSKLLKMVRCLVIWLRWHARFTEFRSSFHVMLKITDCSWFQRINSKIFQNCFLETKSLSGPNGWKHVNDLLWPVLSVKMTLPELWLAKIMHNLWKAMIIHTNSVLIAIISLASAQLNWN